MKTFGANLEDSQAEAIEELRPRPNPETGEMQIASRSQVVREQVAIGLAITDLIERSDLDLDPGRDRVAFARQAVLNQLAREERDE
jgi:hypothetical protein